MQLLVERIGYQLVAARLRRDGLRRRHQHRVGEAARARCECAFEQAGKGQHVVDALAVGGERGAMLARHERLDLRVGVRQREYQLALTHPLGPDEALHPGAGNHDVGALHERLERHALAARRHQPRDRGGIAVRAEHLAHAVGLQQPHDARARRAEADLPDDAALQVDARMALGADERGKHHHGGAVLVIVQHRLGQPRAQLLFDLEALGSGEVFELNGAEGAGDAADDVDHARRLGLLEQYRHAVDADQIGKQRGLAFHDRQPGERADVAEPEHRGAVGDDGDGAADCGEVPGRRGVVADGETYARHSGRVDVAQYLARGDGHGRDGADLAAAMPVEHAVRLAHEARVR